MAAALNCILLATALLARMCAADSDSCTLNITKDSIADSWQSSSFIDHGKGALCFKNQSTETESKYFYRFFHSKASKNDTDAGYHWFVIKLKRPELISSVGIRARAEADKVPIAEINPRGADIEIWTSQTDVDFGHEHCDSKKISSTFIRGESSGIWKPCGRTPSNVSAGQYLSVPCVRQQVRMILLRKYVVNVSDAQNQCMNFIGMWIHKLEIQATIEPFYEVVRNSNVTVSCLVQVCHAAPVILTLAKPNGSTIRTSGNSSARSVSESIQNVNESHAGNYSCTVDDEVLSSRLLKVYYPPSKLSIYSNDTCATEPSYWNFTFESTQSDPHPLHKCFLRDHQDGNATVTTASSVTEVDGKFRSIWKCENCLTVNVTCTAHWNDDKLSWNYSTTESVSCPLTTDSTIPSKFETTQAAYYSTTESNYDDETGTNAGSYSSTWSPTPELKKTVVNRSLKPLFVPIAVVLAVIVTRMAVIIGKRCARRTRDSSQEEQAGFDAELHETPPQFRDPTVDNAENCTYSVMMPRSTIVCATPANNEQGANSRPESVQTVFLLIEHDGN